MMKKSQVSMEFVTIFVFVLVIFSIFLSITTKKLGEISDERDYIFMRDLAENIKKEIILASQVQDNYFRKFELPPNINGRNYTINVTQDELGIYLPDKSYYATLPLDVKGSFAESLNKDTLKHCITKNAWDGIRISLNQVSIEYAQIENGVDNGIPIDDPDKWINIEDLDDSFFDDGGHLILKEDQYFAVYVRINCVENIRTIRTIIDTEPSFAEMKSMEYIFREKTQENIVSEFFGTVPLVDTPNPFFREFGLLTRHATNDKSDLNFDSEGNGILWNDDDEQRHTFNLFTKTCEDGSGNIYKLIYQVNDDLELGDDGFEIRFDPNFTHVESSSVMAIECRKGAKLNSEVVPSTKVSAKFVIE
ncbi:hypothetical protein HOD20_04865 [archaeon]|nr:hypothetical protein [archaeon]MBT4648116.1 hypothetical protein [archaeon]MBT6820830.1 hypothetical protein [archaeon]